MNDREKALRRVLARLSVEVEEFEGEDGCWRPSRLAEARAECECGRFITFASSSGTYRWEDPKHHSAGCLLAREDSEVSQLSKEEYEEVLSRYREDR